MQTGPTGANPLEFQLQLLCVAVEKPLHLIGALDTTGRKNLFSVHISLHCAGW
jgi:hypothetical protein